MHLHTYNFLIAIFQTCNKVSKCGFVEHIITNTPLMHYSFQYVGADLR